MSPITGNDFSPIQWQGSACQQFEQLFQTNEKLALFFNWMFTSGGAVTDEFLEGIADRIAPIGTIQPYGGLELPSDRYVFANGQAISRADYPVLFARYGITYGAGDGTTTFNVPNVINRMLVGSGDLYGRGDTGGEKEVTLTLAQIPAHNHENGEFSHLLRAPAVGSITGSDTANSATEANTGTSAAIASRGGGGAHNNMPPYLAMPAIIKAR